MLRVANAAAGIALALFAGYFLTGIDTYLRPARYGDFGLSFSGATVGAVAPLSSADRAGIKVGDTVERPRVFKERVLLDAPNYAGDRITLVVHHENTSRTVTLRSQPPATTLGDRITGILTDVGAVVFVALGLLLVLLRPSRMTWAFYFWALAITLVNSGPAFTGSAEWQVAYERIQNVIVMVAVAGTLTFAARFPTNNVAGWRKIVDDAAPYLILPGSALLVWHDEAQLNFVEGPLVSWLGTALVTFDSVIVVAATVVLFSSYIASRGPERFKIQWVMLGWICAMISAVFAALGTFVVWFSIPDWLSNTVSLLFVVLPVTVAYAILRHRVIDIRFVLTRSVAIGVSIAVTAMIVVVIDWFFSARMPTSRFEAAVYALAILLAGFSLNAMRGRFMRSVDVLLFPRWHRTQERAALLDEAVRRANDEEALYEPLTTGMASAFALASAALFERVEDGGFLRVAAHGWHAGTVWHILPDDPFVTQQVRKKLRVANGEEPHWQEARFPKGTARPATVVPISNGSHSEAVLLLGAHSNGTDVDADELRIIRTLCNDAALVYKLRPSSNAILSAR